MTENPTDSKDDFGDPGMAELLRRWGTHVRKAHRAHHDGEPSDSGRQGALFEPSAHLPALQAAFDDVDRETDVSPHSRPMSAGRARWFRMPLAAAAMVLLVLGVGWLVRNTGSGSAHRPAGVRVALSDLTLSTTGTRLRGEPSQRFSTGTKVFLHFATDRPCVVAVANLDGALRLKALDDSITRRAAPGPNDVATAIELQGAPGTESLIILAAIDEIDSGAFRDIINKAAGIDTSRYGTHEEALEAILTVLRSDDRISAEAITFAHVAR